MNVRESIMDSSVGYVVYEYVFRWPEFILYKNNRVESAKVSVAFHVYKDGKEVYLEDEPEPYTDIYFSDIVTVRCDAKEGIVLEKNENISELFQIMYEYDDIRAEIVGYSFDCCRPLPEEQKREFIPEEFNFEVVSFCEEIPEDEFKVFMYANSGSNGLRHGNEAKVGMVRIQHCSNED